MANLAVIYGSVRTDRKGIRAARFVVDQLRARDHSVTLVDPREDPLPLLDRMYKEFDAGEAPETMTRLARVLALADGFVVVSAEYNHGVPPALKNTLDHFQREYLFKPSAIVTYSAGPFGGVRVAAKLRDIMAELGTPSIPSAFAVARVQNALDEQGHPTDPALPRRAKRFLDEFEWYLRAFRREREQGTPY